jgi:hypothetical protein
MADLLDLLKHFEKDYTKQLMTNFRDYQPSICSLEENNKVSIPQLSHTLDRKENYNKVSKVQNYTTPESRTKQSEKICLKFTSDKGDEFKNKKNIPFFAIIKDLLGDFEYELNSFLQNKKDVEKLVFEYVSATNCTDFVSFALESRDLLLTYPKITPRILFLAFWIKIFKDELEQMGKREFFSETNVTYLTHNRKVYHQQLKEKGLEPIICNSLVELLLDIEKSYFSIKNHIFSGLAEQKNTIQRDKERRKDFIHAKQAFNQKWTTQFDDYFQGVERNKEVIRCIPPDKLRARNVIGKVIDDRIIINFHQETSEFITIHDNDTKLCQLPHDFGFKNKYLVLAQNRNHLQELLDENIVVQKNNKKKSRTHENNYNSSEDSVSLTYAPKVMTIKAKRTFLPKVALWKKIGIVIALLNLICAIYPLLNLQSTDPTIANYGIYIFVSLIISALILSAKGSFSFPPSIWRLTLKSKLKRLFQSPRVYLRSLTSIYIVGAFLIVFGIMTLIFNLLYEGLTLSFICVLILGYVMPPSSQEESKRGSIRKRRGAGIFCIITITAMAFGWAAVYQSNEFLSAPSFGLASQESRRYGVGIEPSQLAYTDDLADVEDITFNSMFFLKFNLGASFAKSFILTAKLIPVDVLVEGDLYEESLKLRKTFQFSSRQYRGPFSHKDIYFGIDLENTPTPVLPGEYQLVVYSVARYAFLRTATSNSHTYNITIEKDRVFFTPYYGEEPPLRISRRGNIYSVYDKNILGWQNIFDTKAVNSLGHPVKGDFELYLTQREGNAPVYKKVADYTTRADGSIWFTNITRSHYKEYMRAKIFYNGEQSLFLRSTTHLEDCEVSENKFLHTSSFPDEPVNYNGQSLPVITSIVVLLISSIWM